MRFDLFAAAIERVKAVGGDNRNNGPQRRACCLCYVNECSLIRSTRGSDFCVNLQLVDLSSNGEPATNLELIIFCEKPHLLPQVRREGDILLLRNVQVQFYNGKPQLMSRIARSWEHFYYQLYSLHEDHDEPYAWGGWGVETGAEPGPLVLTEEAKQLLQDMKALRGDCTGGSDTSYLRRLSQLSPPDDPDDRPPPVDIKAQVLCVDESDRDATVVYVWDGTDVRPLPRGFKMRCSQWNGRRGDPELLMGPLKKWTMPLKAPVVPAAAVAAAAVAAAGPEPPGSGPAAAATGSGRTPAAAAAGSGQPAAGHVDTGSPGAGAGAGAGPSSSPAAAAAASPGARVAVSTATAPSVTLVSELPRMGSVLPVVVKGSVRSARPRSMEFPVVGSWVSMKVVGLQLVQGQLQAIMGDSGKFSSELAPGNATRLKLLEEYGLREKYNITCTQLPPPPQQQAAAGAAAGPTARAGGGPAAAGGGPPAGEVGPASGAGPASAAGGAAEPGPASGAAAGAGRSTSNGAAAGADQGTHLDQAAAAAAGEGPVPHPLSLLPPVCPPCVGWRVSRCTCPDVRHVTLREVLLTRGSGRSQTFRVWARISDYWPTNLQQWCCTVPVSRTDPAAAATAGASRKRPREEVFVWNFKCRLEDATGELDAVVCGRNGEQLLGLKPCGLSNNPEQLQQLHDVIGRLSQMDPRGEGAAWLDLAVTSLYPEGVEGGGAAEAACQYALHDAQVMGEEELVRELAAREERYTWNVQNGYR